MHLNSRCLAAIALAGLAFITTVTTVDVAAAQSRQQAPAARQLALTDKQIEAALAAHKDFESFTAKQAPSSSVAGTNANIVAQMDALAKKHGFATYADYTIVLDNVGLVMAGVDPTTKIYVGPAAAFKQKIAAVQADKSLSAEDKAEAVADLQNSMKTPLPAVEHKGNIDLVIKHYDRLAAILKDE